MQNFTFKNPTEIIFGMQTIFQIGEEAAKFGNKVLLVYGQGSIKKNGVYDNVVKSLKGAKLEITEFFGVKSNPVLSHLEEGITLAKREKINVIVAVGGGSVLDESKAIAAGAKTDGDVWDFFVNQTSIQDALPLLTVLTLSATGSEMNPTAVITNEGKQQKFEISSPFLFPKVSILDPTTMYSVPKSYTAYSAVDTISHVIEGYFTGDDPYTPIQDRIVEGIVQSIMENTEICLDNPQDYQGRAVMMWAATLALNGLPVSGIGEFSFPNHMIEHSLSAIYDIAHGAGLSIVIPGWMTYAASGAPVKFAQFAERIFGIVSNSPERTAEMGIEALKSWFRNIGSPVSLSEVNISENDIEMIAENATMLAQKWQLHEYTKDVITEVLKLCC